MKGKVLMDTKTKQIRENERLSHTEIYTKEKLYDTDTWVKPPIFEDSKEFFEKSPIPIYIVSNIDTD